MSTPGYERWSFLTEFHARAVTRSWAGVRAMVDELKKLVDSERELRDKLIGEWNAVLHNLGGDPLNEDWSTFRPLRLSREEDWSDWFAHLLASSCTGMFASVLFPGRQPRDCVKPTVEREKWVGEHRVDLLVHWSDGRYSHLEIKIGDLSLAKTIAEAEALAREYSDVDHWIVLPKSDLPRWAAVIRERPSSRCVTPVTWEDPAIALRRALLLGNESLTWQVWSWSFLGAIHQRLLGHPRVANDALPATMRNMTFVLRKGMQR